MKEKMLIYQVLPRLFGNDNTNRISNGTLKENGVGKFADFSDQALKGIKKMGFSHVWYTGILEHATQTDYSKYGITQDHPDVTKGIAGSPYAIKDYYDVCPDFADKVENRIEEFEELIERTHSHGMKVIIDFVPNHVSRQYKSDKKPKGIKDIGENDDKNVSFVASNNYYYLPCQRLEPDFIDVHKSGGYEEFPAKVTGNDVFCNRPSVNDWYETIKVNYGVDYQNNRAQHFDPIPNTWLKMKDILLYWAEKGIDGFRCDMIEMVPVEFWNWITKGIKLKHKDIIFIGEAYDPRQYENYIYNGGFDYLYDKVGLYDTIRNVICGTQPTSDITFCWQKVDKIQSHMLNFLENHDEQRIASDFFVGSAQKAIPGFHISVLMNNNPYMHYFAQELGERGMDKEGFSGGDGRTTIFDYWSLDSMVKWRNNGKYNDVLLTPEQKKIRDQYVNTLLLASNEKCIKNGRFFDLMYANYENTRFDSTRQFVFLRYMENEFLLLVSNFADYDVDVVVDIPMDVYRIMGIDPIEIKSAQELLSNKNFNDGEINLHQIPLSIGANDSVAVKFLFK